MARYHNKLNAVEGFSESFNRLVKSLLNLSADHHAHHHIEFAVKHHTDTGIGWGDLVELNPEAEVNRYAAIITSDFDMFAVDLINHSEFNGKALYLE